MVTGKRQSDFKLTKHDASTVPFRGELVDQKARAAPREESCDFIRPSHLDSIESAQSDAGLGGGAPATQCCYCRADTLDLCARSDQGAWKVGAGGRG